MNATPKIRTRISYSSVFKIMGQLLCVESLILLLPLAVELCYGDTGWLGFVIASAGAGAAGAAMWLPFRYRKIKVERHESYLLTTIAWFIFSAFGMIPFIMQPFPLSVADAFFETVSGFTTTGATVIADVERLGHGLLLWRALTQWLGGLGIILFMLAILPSLNDTGSVPLYNAETTGIIHTKLHPRIRQSAMALWQVYLILTSVLVILLWMGPMNFFDAVCQSFACMSTGGFSTRNAGIAAWDSTYADLIITVFMFAGGINFALIYGAFRRDFRSLFSNDVFRCYCGIILAAYFILATIRITAPEVHDVYSVFTVPLFQVVSAITSTGFSLCDIGAWGSLAVLVTMILMACGACAGSTTGAMKVDRVEALARNLRNEIRSSIHPKRVYFVKVDGNVLSGYELKRVTAFFTIFMLLIVAGALLVCSSGIGLEDSFFAAISCIGNNGLGLGVTAEGCLYGNLPAFVKWVFCLLMVVGRLELFSVLVLFSPAFWRK